VIRLDFRFHYPLANEAFKILNRQPTMPYMHFEDKLGTWGTR